MRTILKKGAKGLVIGLVATILVALGIDASDHYNNMTESLIGRMILSEPRGPCPDDMAFVPNENGGFCIDKYEAAPDEKCPVRRISSQLGTQSNINSRECEPVSRPGLSPWLFVSQSQAAAACAKAGKRLPTSDEWYQASLGTPDNIVNPNENDCQISANWPDQPGKTGSGDNCVSSFGAYDMIGNVWEWVKGEVREGKMAGHELPPSGFITGVDISGAPIETNELLGDENFNDDYFWIKKTGIRGIARGGYWDNKEKAGVYSVYIVVPPNYAGSGIGFRCAK